MWVAGKSILGLLIGMVHLISAYPIDLSCGRSFFRAIVIDFELPQLVVPQVCRL